MTLESVELCGALGLAGPPFAAHVPDVFLNDLLRDVFGHQVAGIVQPMNFLEFQDLFELLLLQP